MTRFSMAAAVFVVGFATTAMAQDWSTVGYIDHSTYQAVNADGSPTYDSTFPIRLVGVVLNNTEDWLDPTPGYTSTVQMFNMGGQAEFYIQAVNLDGTPWDTDPGSAFDDFGGTAAWIGQNYGNLPFTADPGLNYTDEQFTAELGRLGLFGGDGVTEPVRAGDLVEIRARGGLHYGGKFNVNEQHSLSSNTDYEVVILQRNFGLPDATPITLADLKLTNDTAIFDDTRQTGGERYQSTLVELQDVWVTGTVDWSSDTNITVTDGLRTLNIYLGLNPSFDGTELFVAGEHFNVTGILDQAASNGALSTDGYQVLVMNAADLVAVPEPAALGVLLAGGLWLCGKRSKMG